MNNVDLETSNMLNVLEQQDKIILQNNSDLCKPTLDDIEKMLEQRNIKDFAEKHLNKIYSKDCWYKKEKSRSIVMGKLLPYSIYLANNNIHIDDVVKTICSFLHFTDSDTFFKVPDRYIIYRNQLSLAKMDIIYHVLERTELAEIKRNGQEIHIKLNRESLENDEYIKLKLRKTAVQDCKAIMYFEQEYKTMYYYEFTKYTIFKRRRGMLLGLIYNYCLLTDKYFKTEEQKIREAFYGKRDDIIYVEIPIHIITKVLNMSETRVIKYLRKLCKTTKYIAKHDKVYIITNGINNYYNESYKTENDIVDYDKVELPEGHPNVTKFSFIIFKDEFFNSNIFKKFIEPRNDEFKELIINNIKELVNNKEYYQEKYISAEVEQQFEQQIPTLAELVAREKDKSLKTKCGKVDEDNTDQIRVIRQLAETDNFYVTDLKAEALKSNYTLNDMRIVVSDKSIQAETNLNRIVNKIASIMKKFDNDCRSEEFSYYSNAINKLIIRAKEIYNKNKKWTYHYISKSKNKDEISMENYRIEQIKYMIIANA